MQIIYGLWQRIKSYLFRKSDYNDCPALLWTRTSNCFQALIMSCSGVCCFHVFYLWMQFYGILSTTTSFNQCCCYNEHYSDSTFLCCSCLLSSIACRREELQGNFMWNMWGRANNSNKLLKISQDISQNEGNYGFFLHLLKRLTRTIQSSESTLQ